jgi:flagellar biosynthesis protein
MLPLADSLDIRDDDERGQEQKADKQSRQIAVALSYRPGGVDDAPKVVASGQGETARQILELAFSQGVRVREDPDLAQILAAVEIDSVIPLSAFVAVAEILSYVYRANNQPIPEPAL